MMWCTFCVSEWLELIIKSTLLYLLCFCYNQLEYTFGPFKLRRTTNCIFSCPNYSLLALNGLRFSQRASGVQCEWMNMQWMSQWMHQWMNRMLLLKRESERDAMNTNWQWTNDRFFLSSQMHIHGHMCDISLHCPRPQKRSNHLKMTWVMPCESKYTCWQVHPFSCSNVSLSLHVLSFIFSWFCLSQCN